MSETPPRDGLPPGEGVSPPVEVVPTLPPASTSGVLPSVDAPYEATVVDVTVPAAAAAGPTLAPWQDEWLHQRPRYVYRRRVVMPIVLFVLTCLSTFWAGSCQGSPHAVLAFLAGPEAVMEIVGNGWRDGLIYMTAVLGILLAHEMGHFWQAARNGVPASWPMFIPMPIMPLGTMGAVIAMQGGSADRRQLFDIGLMGPLAGLAVAIPVAWIGILRAVPVDGRGAIDNIVFENPLLMQSMIQLLHPGLPGNQVFHFDPLMRAAWVGMLITGLNMMPISQLDGGHVAYALFGKQSKYIAYGVVLAAGLFMAVTGQYGWIVMLSLVIAIGVVHRPTADDHVPLGRARQIIGLLSLIIPILCFNPWAISFTD